MISYLLRWPKCTLHFIREITEENTSNPNKSQWWSENHFVNATTLSIICLAHINTTLCWRKTNIDVTQSNVTCNLTDSWVRTQGNDWIWCVSIIEWSCTVRLFSGSHTLVYIIYVYGWGGANRFLVYVYATCAMRIKAHISYTKALRCRMLMPMCWCYVCIALAHNHSYKLRQQLYFVKQLPGSQALKTGRGHCVLVIISETRMSLPWQERDTNTHDIPEQSVKKRRVTYRYQLLSAYVCYIYSQDIFVGSSRVSVMSIPLRSRVIS